MARRLSVGLHGSAVDAGGLMRLLSRLGASTSALVIALAIAMAAVGGAFIGHPGSPWMPLWGTVAEDAKSHPLADHADPREQDPARADRANDDGYLDGLARALGYESVEQMTRAGRPHAPANLVHR